MFSGLRFVTSALFILAAPAGAQPGPAALPAETVARIDKLVEDARAAGPVPGVSLVVIQGDRVLLSKAYGYADLENKKPMTTRSTVMLGSTMKAMTSTLR